MLNIQILGVKEHKKTEQLKQNIALAMNELALDFPIEEISDIESLLSAKIAAIPALKIEDKIIIQEEIPSVEDLKILFKVLLNEEPIQSL